MGSNFEASLLLGPSFNPKTTDMLPPISHTDQTLNRMTSKPSINPRTWRFTWEAQSHIPILRLYLFNPHTKPNQYDELNVKLFLEQLFLTVTWFEGESNLEVSLRVPVPRVLIDVESPVNFKALDDHIEVKFALLLPIDHPILLNFDSVMSLSEENVSLDELKPLSMDSDLKKLSSGDEVHFYCRNCSTKLTKSLRFFKEMPSVNWREAADNWFGTCCCSFGGISEKLVRRYAKSYTCAMGLCLLNTTSVVLCKDDLVGSRFRDQNGSPEYESLDISSDKWLRKLMPHNADKDAREVCLGNQNKRLHNCEGELNHCCPGEDNLAAQIDLEVSEEVINGEISSCVFQMLQVKEAIESARVSCVDTKNYTQNHDTGCCTDHASEPSPEEQITRENELANQKSFLNGYLGNSFMAKSAYLSKDVQWFEFLCPQCSFPVGAYPRDNGDAPLDDSVVVASLDNGVHLFKCYISTTLDVGKSTDLFRNYTLERMFTSQLLESANDELSFRTMIRDLQTRSPMLQIVLLNPNSWCSTGYCLDTLEPVPKIDMCPTIKLLFSDCSSSSESQSRMIEEWIMKNQVDEAYMLASQIKELMESLKAGHNIFPPSHASLQGLSLSSLRR